MSLGWNTGVLPLSYEVIQSRRLSLLSPDSELTGMVRVCFPGQQPQGRNAVPGPGARRPVLSQAPQVILEPPKFEKHRLQLGSPSGHAVPILHWICSIILNTDMIMTFAAPNPSVAPGIGQFGAALQILLALPLISAIAVMPSSGQVCLWFIGFPCSFDKLHKQE